MNIAIIGEDEGGKTTFLVLLYAAQVRYTARDETGFRFYINPKSIKAISPEYNKMHAGAWPSEKLIENFAQVSFLIGRTHDGSNKGFLKFFNKFKEPTSISLNFSIYDFADKELSGIINNSAMAVSDPSQKVASLLSSRVLIIVIDISNIQKQKSAKPEGNENNNDVYVANVLANITRYKRNMVYPIIIFTKFDAVDPKLLTSLKLPRKPPGTAYKENRNKYAECIMTKYYPHTLNLVRKNERINYEDGIYFFSSVKTVKDPKGNITPALKQSNEVKYILDCSYQEFIGFIECLETISKDIENNKK